MLVRNEYPKTLVKYLGGKGCLVTEKEAGIYTVSGNVFFNIMILTTGSLDQTEYIWLNSLRSDLKKNEYMNLLKRSSEMNIVEGDYPDWRSAGTNSDFCEQTYRKSRTRYRSTIW